MPKYKRSVSASKEASVRVDKKGTIKILSDNPVDRSNCKCVKEIIKKKKNDTKKAIRCPRRNEPDLKKYSIYCSNCEAKVAEVYAKDKSMSDWADLHYYVECKKNKIKTYTWRGAMAINISPIDEKLGIECTCGNDTRDFRANTTMPSALVQPVIEENMKGREFGKEDSKFYLK